MVLVSSMASVASPEALPGAKSACTDAMRLR